VKSYMEKTTITILCENRASLTKNIMGEHGFSAFVEQNGKKILLDTGQGLGLKPNAKTLGIDLDQIDTIVLSHGHYDHTGGLSQLLPFAQKTRVIAHPDIFIPKYFHEKDNLNKKFSYIGSTFSRDTLENDPNCELILQKNFIKISDGIFFSGQVPRITDFETNDKRLKLKHKKGLSDDLVFDDTSLLIETGKGPVILTGCAHSGIVNVMKHFENMTGHRQFYGVIGGTHIGFLNSDDQIEKTMAAFETYGLDLIAVSHCTGNEASAICYNRFKKKFVFANAGCTIKI
jgi:7,8-dihydropterin-6-yl-methyl-4-(beta-D-ribofuranosyl)aminobenzene 5'-phosphate synthase